MDGKKSLVLYHDIRQPLELLTDEQRGKLFMSLLDYSEYGTDPGFSPIPNIGTTHADTFHDDVPVTGEIPSDRIRDAYEEATGDVIVETFHRLGLDPVATPGALAVHHGPFTWGRDAADAVEHAVILEEVAKIAALSVALNPAIRMNRDLIEKHYSRKHGPKAYYGQGENK